MHITYAVNSSNTKAVKQHLQAVGPTLPIPLSEVVDIHKYSEKIKKFAVRYEAWHEETLVGLIAVYQNHETKIIYVTHVGVLSSYQTLGIASKLMKSIIAKYKDFKIDLMVHHENYKVIAFYKRHGFMDFKKQKHEIMMRKENVV